MLPPYSLIACRSLLLVSRTYTSLLAEGFVFLVALSVCVYLYQYLLVSVCLACSSLSFCLVQLPGYLSIISWSALSVYSFWYLLSVLAILAHCRFIYWWRVFLLFCLLSFFVVCCESPAVLLLV